ncbi:hypothetical protein DFH27DRAFT_623067, partial [Peziza echinospora]
VCFYLNVTKWAVFRKQRCLLPKRVTCLPPRNLRETHAFYISRDVQADLEVVLKIDEEGGPACEPTKALRPLPLSLPLSLSPLHPPQRPIPHVPRCRFPVSLSPITVRLYPQRSQRSKATSYFTARMKLLVGLTFVAALFARASAEVIHLDESRLPGKQDGPGFSRCKVLSPNRAQNAFPPAPAMRGSTQTAPSSASDPTAQTTQIIYHCFAALCEPQQLDPVMHYTLRKCGAHTGPNPNLFENAAYHDQAELNDLHARALSGSAIAPTRKAFPFSSFFIGPSPLLVLAQTTQVPEEEKHPHHHHHARHLD